MGTAALREDISERIRSLKQRFLDTRPTVCTERAKFYTDIYRRHEARPLIIRRALALEETLQRMSILIDDDELIVGNQSSRLRAAPIFPEYAVGWILEELDEFDKRAGDAFYLSQKDKEELRAICAYWQGKTLLERGLELMPEQVREIHEAGIIRAEGNLTSGDAHLAVNFEKILRIGLGGYLELAADRRSALELTDWADLKKEQFYKAVEIALKATQRFIGRFRDLALMQSRVEDDPRRKKELQTIHGVCDAIASGPPQSFHQALQLTYFIQLILQIESNGHSVSLGRMDQYLYPFYKRDVEAGRLTAEEARELLECTWLKLLSINKIRSWSHTRYSAGSPLYQNVTIGGQTPDGKDAVNELSYLILDSVGRLRLTQPNLSVRYHRGIGDEFLMKCIEVIERGFGMPAFNNDQIVIPSLIDLGVQKADAYDYSAIGCIEVAVPGKWGYRVTGMSFLNARAPGGVE
jgi:pyruvate formate-lyase/glycerol dehydratase family glycyl radical enzyme